MASLFAGYRGAGIRRIYSEMASHIADPRPRFFRTAYDNSSLWIFLVPVPFAVLDRYLSDFVGPFRLDMEPLSNLSIVNPPLDCRLRGR